MDGDGYWKVVLLEPDGRLHCVPLLTLVATVGEAPPRLFVWGTTRSVLRQGFIRKRSQRATRGGQPRLPGTLCFDMPRNSR